MKLALFDARSYDVASFSTANGSYGHELAFFDVRLDARTAVLASGFPAVCSFVNDRLDAATLATLHAGGTRLVALRSAGFNHVDLDAAASLGLMVVRVPDYSPHAVAEHAFALLLGLVRKVPRSTARVRDANFSLEALVGFELNGKTMGVVGTGRIGRVVARIARGFGCRVVAFDPRPDDALAASLGLDYVPLERLFAEADIVTLHCPLTPATRHVVDAAAFARMKPGAILVNTGRGALIDTVALVAALKKGTLGGACLDVYEEEEALFFRDLSDRVLQDDVLARLLTFPNVVVTAHQGFLTREALADIARTTLDSVSAFASGRTPAGDVVVRRA